MEDLIVTNSQSVDRPGNLMTFDEFLEAAGSDEGLDLSGDLFLDVGGLDEETYEALSEAIPGAIYFSTDNNTPSFIGDDVKVFDWAERSTSSDPLEQAEEDNVFETDDPNIKRQDQIEVDDDFDNSSYENKQARIILFGSSKGGTGKTFTCLISAYRYAKMHPDQKVAVSDFDIIDGQIGITVHKITPTMLEYYKRYKFGEDDFATMERFKTKSENFPQNLDFYLAPRDMYIDDNDFWDSIFVNLIENYDVIFFDSGIDYMHYKPISTLYKIADKIILVSTTSIKSVSSVSKQIKRLKGEIENPVFSKEDEIGDKLNLVITQAGKTDEMNSRVFATFKPKINIIGVFGVLTPAIQKAEYYGDWAIFDNKTKFNKTIDKMVE